MAAPRVLLTGAGGFLGRRVSSALTAAGAEVVDPRDLLPGADLLDDAARAAVADRSRAEILVHTAWITAHGAFWTSDLNAAWEHATGDLFARFAAAGGRRIVALGSVAEYDWTTDAARLAEDAPLRPATPYGAAKARTCDALARLSAREGFEALWARIFLPFGSGEPPARIVPAIIRAGLTGEPLATGPGETTRDFAAVEALGRVLADLALADATGPVNVASGVGTRFDTIAATVADALGRPVPIRFGARALAEGEPVRLVADTTRLAATGIAPPPDPRAAIAAYARELAEEGRT
jgi:nucleoside-diphosphate-sugar epimerase